jgi:hypothetical protein
MKIMRKIQLSAAAVIANGLLALTTLSPSPALASGCSSHNYSPGCGCVTCATFSGCTLQRICTVQPPICGGRIVTICNYT